MQFFFHKGHLLHYIHKNDNENERKVKFKLKLILSPRGERSFKVCLQSCFFLLTHVDFTMSSPP